jgi:hypothetical protein
MSEEAAASQAPLGPDQNYGLEGKLLWIQKNVFDLGMCFDKREKGESLERWFLFSLVLTVGF